MVFARKMPKFYMIIAPKFFLEFWGHMSPLPSQSPMPMDFRVKSTNFLIRDFWTQVPDGHKCCCSWGSYQIFQVLRLFHFRTDRH